MRHILRHLSLTIAAIGLCVACAAPGSRPTYPTPPPMSSQRQQDHLACLAQARQAAMGAGAWTSVAPVRAAIYDHATEQYYGQCMQAKGYR